MLGRSRNTVLKGMLAAAVVGAAAMGALRLPRATAVPDPPPAARPAAAIAFEEVAEAAGLRFRWETKPRPMRNIDAFGCGAAFFDWDNDGLQDIFLVGEPTGGLFRNRGEGRFEDLSTTVGLDRHRGLWKGVGVGDYDGDGWQDLVVTGYHRLLLLRNVVGRRLEDRTRAAGLDPGNWHDWGASAGFMDLDADGDLELLLLNYVITGPGIPEFCEMIPGVRSGCPPSRYRPEFARLFRAEGARFREITAASGLKETHGKALVLAFADVNGDGRPDFYIGNDGTPADLMENRGGLRFRNVGVASGTAYGATPGHPIAAMGADWADYDRDGLLDLAVSAFSDEPYSLLHQREPGLFEHTGDTTGITGATFKPLGFGTNWIDVDNDACADLVFANGHVYDNCEKIDPLQTFRQPLMLFHNRRRGQSFVDLVPELGGALAAPLLGRGSATGDFDNDGRMDLLVVDYEGSPRLLRNRSETGNHWLKLHLVGRGRNRAAYGAVVTGRAGHDVWVGQVSPAGSYLSSGDPRVHFGLGATARLETIEVRWPSGRREALANPPVDRILVVREGSGIEGPPGEARR